MEVGGEGWVLAGTFGGSLLFSCRIIESGLDGGTSNTSTKKDGKGRVGTSERDFTPLENGMCPRGVHGG